MNVHVRMYSCMYIYMYVSMESCIHVCMYACMRVCCLLILMWNGLFSASTQSDTCRPGKDTFCAESAGEGPCVPSPSWCEPPTLADMSGIPASWSCMTFVELSSEMPASACVASSSSTHGTSLHPRCTAALRLPSPGTGPPRPGPRHTRMPVTRIWSST
jgi:hypothetical protein